VQGVTLRKLFYAASLTTSASNAFLASFDFKPRQSEWCEGFYFVAEAMNTGIVVIDELPETLETVWLRIFGKGKTQQQAIKTLATLEDKGPLLDNVLEVFHT
jgi:arginine/lysine/ornithine decarboxylase